MTGCNCSSKRSTFYTYRYNKNDRYGGKPHHRGRVYAYPKKYYQKNRRVRRRNRFYVKEDLYIKFKAISEKDLRSWNLVHLKAKNALTAEQQDEFKEYLKFLANSFPCPKCRPHIKSYLDQNPMRKDLTK